MRWDSMYEVISFDLDGTLVSMDFVNSVWLEKIPEIYAENHQISIEKAKKYVMDEYMKVGPEAIEWYDIHYWIKKFKLDVEWKDLLMSCSNRLKLYPEVREVLERLSKKGNLIIISNAAHEFIEVEISMLSLSPYFKRIFSAVSDFGRTKKDSWIYRRVMDEMDVDGKSAIHVGDNYEFDYLAALDSGMSAYYLDRRGKIEGNHVVHNLKEFEEKLMDEIK